MVCSCLSVSEADVRDAIEAGADSVADVGERCEAGTGCTTCHETIRWMLEAHARGELRAGRAPVALRQLPLFDAKAGPVIAGSHSKKRSG